MDERREAGSVTIPLAHSELCRDAELTALAGGAAAADGPLQAIAPPLRSVVIVGKRSDTNDALAAAFAELGISGRVADDVDSSSAARDDVAIGRIDVLPTLDGIEHGLGLLSRLQRRGVRVLNGPQALIAAHDKLSTALFLGRAGIAQPRAAHLRGVSFPSFPPPYVVKPRFGSWGRDVYLCRDEDELRTRLERLGAREWFRRQGAIAQSLIEPTGRDLRVVVAAGRVVGAVERHARPGEWRTNVALGAVRRSVQPSVEARALALRAVAALGLDLAGVDIVGVPGRLQVLEVNGAVDFTDAYGTGIFTSTAEALLRCAEGDGYEAAALTDVVAEAAAASA